MLYSDDTFRVNTSYVEWSCIYLGKYSIHDNILRLERNDLEEVTDNVFTTKYRIKASDSLLIPFKKGVKNIKLSSW